MPGGLLSCVALVDMAQDTAARHAASFGMGLHDHLPQNAIWVLGRLRLEVCRYPRLGDAVTVETWPAGLQRRTAWRAFRYSVAGTGVMAAGLTSWSLFDAVRRRPLGRLDAVFDAVPAPGPAPIAFASSPPTGPSTGARVLPLRPRPAEIDVYGHVNNAHLVAWLLGAGHGLVDAPFQPTALEAVFRAECRLDDALELLVARTGDHCATRLSRADGIDVVRGSALFGS